MIPEIFILLTLPLSILGTISYIRGIIRGVTHPNAVSWIIWTIAPLVGTFLALKSGAGWSVWPIFMAGFTPLLVVIVATFKKNAYWKMSKLDIFCAILSVFALLLWILTNKTGISIFFAILSDLLAAIPTFTKSWNFPETEDSGPYLAGVVNNIIGLLVIKNWRFSIYSFGIYFIFLNATLLYMIYRKRFANLFARTV